MKSKSLFWLLTTVLLTTAPVGRTSKRDSGLVHVETLDKIKVIIPGG